MKSASPKTASAHDFLRDAKATRIAPAPSIGTRSTSQTGGADQLRSSPASITNLRGSGDMRTMLPMSVSKDDILALSVSERIQLVEEIWDSIATEPETVPLTGAQRKELDRRKREHRLDPSAAKAWPEVRARLERRQKCADLRSRLRSSQVRRMLPFTAGRLLLED
jgi:putative addiction module component (TIGR02574 family)